MTKITEEIGVTFTIKGTKVPIKGPVRSKYDIDGNLILTFNIGVNGQDKVELIFDKRKYLNIKDE